MYLYVCVCMYIHINVCMYVFVKQNKKCSLSVCYVTGSKQKDSKKRAQTPSSHLHTHWSTYANTLICLPNSTNEFYQF